MTIAEATVVRFTVLADATERLDRFLADQLSLSRTQAARVVAAGGVRVAGAVARASRLLKYREEVIVELPPSCFRTVNSRMPVRLGLANEAPI